MLINVIILIQITLFLIILVLCKVEIQASLSEIQEEGVIDIEGHLITNKNETFSSSLFDAVFLPQLVLNDDYCDDLISGSDETNTSACSYYSSQQSFLCTKDGLTPIYLPMSRIHDGICDCCDGRDEINSPFPSLQCPNTCEQSLTQLRKHALTHYRNIQAGIRKRTEWINTYQKKKLQENKNYQELVEEAKTLITMITRMKFFLTFELERENRLRWQLLREREHHCAAGFTESCDYFFNGFVNEDELMYEGYPFAYSAARKKKRFIWEYTKEEKDYLQRVKGSTKVKAMICTKRHLLPDDNSRIFTVLSDYLEYIESPAGYANLMDRSKVTPKKMQENNIFSLYLENGERGHILASVLFWEAVGLVLAPLTVPLQGVYSVYNETKRWIWGSLEHQEKVYDQYLQAQYPTQYQSHTVEREEDATVIPVSAPVEFYFYYYLKQAITLILDTDREGTEAFEFMNYLDPERYPFTDYVLSQYYRYMAIPFWISEVILRSPKMYYDLYINGKFEELPPRRNPCLLREGIQTGEEELLQIQKQIQQYLDMKEILLQKKLEYLLEKEEQELSGSSSKSKDRKEKKDRKEEGFWTSLYSFFSSPFTFSKPSKKKVTSSTTVVSPFTAMGLLQSLWSPILPSPSIKTTTASLTNANVPASIPKHYEQLQKVYLDYGEGNDWESVDHVCIWKEIEQQYNYTYCFFDEITQNTHTSLGKFSHWGNNLFQTTQQQYPFFYSLLAKYAQLYQSRGGGGGGGGVATSLEKEFEVKGLVNIYDLQDAILEKNAYEPLYEKNFYYQTFHYYFMNNTIYQSLQQALSPEELSNVFIYFTQLYHGKPSSSSAIEAPHTQLKKNLLKFYQTFFPKVENNTPRIIMKPRDEKKNEKERLLREQLHLYYSQQIYEDGTDCPVRPGIKRKTIVYLDCGSENMIAEVKEYEICQYEMRVVTPLVCTVFLENRALLHLEELGVFGFAKKN